MGGMTGAAIGKFGNQGPAQGGAEYTPAQTRPTYQPAFNSNQTAQAMPQAAPQAMPQQMMPQAPQGLQGLMSQIMARYQNPYQMQMNAPAPLYRSSALNYRPNMAQAQQSLSRVKPSVYKTDLDTARSRIAELEAAQAVAQQPQDYGYGNSPGG